MATHSSILAWEIPWTEKPGRLQSMGSQRVGHDWATNTSQTEFKLILQRQEQAEKQYMICMYACVLSCFSHIQLFVILWTVTHRALLSMGFPKQEYWSGLPFPSPRDLPDPGTKLGSPALQADSLPTESAGKPITASIYLLLCHYDSNCIVV